MNLTPGLVLKEPPGDVLRNMLEHATLASAKPTDDF